MNAGSVHALLETKCEHFGLQWLIEDTCSAKYILFEGHATKMPLHYGQFNLEYIAYIGILEYIITTSLFRKGSIGKVYQVPHQINVTYQLAIYSTYQDRTESS